LDQVVGSYESIYLSLSLSLSPFFFLPLTCLKSEVKLEAFPHRRGEDQRDEYVCDRPTFDVEGGHFDLSDGLVVVFEDALAAGDGDVEPVGVVAVEEGEDAVS